VEEELKKLDDEEEHQRMSQCLNNVNLLNEQGLKLIILLDGMKSLDTETKRERKNCIHHLQNDLLDKIDLLVDELEEEICAARGIEYVPKTKNKRNKRKRKKKETQS